MNAATDPQACYDEWLSTMSGCDARPYDETVSNREDDLVLAYEVMMRAGATPALDYCGRNVYDITSTGPRADRVRRHVGRMVPGMNAATTMNARRAGTCDRCSTPILPGDVIGYNGPGAVTCATCEPMPKATGGRRASGRSGRGYGRAYYGTGRNGGRCEDAPCCGCCS